MKAWSDVETRKRNEQQYRTVSSDLRGGFWCGLHSHVKKCTFVDGTSSQICCTYNLPSQSSSRLSRLSFSHPCLASQLSHTSHTARILDSNSHNLMRFCWHNANTNAVAFSYTSDMMFAATTQFTTKPACWTKMRAFIPTNYPPRQHIRSVSFMWHLHTI